ncbi:hypothetical protein Nwi_1256 [Nitrobacter winogradskyi Nb-255]|uniref:Uncharacterized protein n=1 Tax=Nitrobacter winogradskyi (strain ATCC 25391 / DSM 10237 / CIP 104748 / NCIMB 11846 / Nb-255) TaxID=323098 RepID=Q3ST74_NITWN|nr:hypothetical protein Nwi_1256 [Nitrobacter winogradskyi Nb-255]
MLGDSNRIGASQVDQSPEAVLRVFRAQGLHATPRYSRRSYWPIWPKTQWIPDSGGFPKRNPVAGGVPRFARQHRIFARKDP